MTKKKGLIYIFYILLGLTKEKKLQFAAYSSGDPLQLNRYRIFEPISSVIFPVEKLDLVLVPFVAFDEEGNRLALTAIADLAPIGLEQTINHGRKKITLPHRWL